MDINIGLCGYGNVGRGLIELIDKNSKDIKDKYNLNLKVTAIIVKEGVLSQSEGMDLKEMLSYGKGGKAVINYAKDKLLKIAEDFPKDIQVLVEASPTNIQNGEPGRSYALEAMSNGAHAVFASKGALVKDYKLLKKISKENNVKIKYSGATAAALPTLDLLASLRGANIKFIEGILNGTTNYILTQMSEKNLSFQMALEEAIEKGIAEKDSSLDVKGMDTACKILLIANEVFNKEYTLEDVNITGIENITEEDIRLAKEKGKVIKLIGTAYVKENSEEIAIEVKPKAIELEHVFSKVNNKNKAISYFTEEMGEIIAIGGASDPKGAAAAVLKDIINLCLEEGKEKY